MLVEMADDYDENNVLKEVLDSILEQIVSNNDVTQPESEDISSTNSLNGLKYQFFIKIKLNE